MSGHQELVETFFSHMGFPEAEVTVELTDGVLLVNIQVPQQDSGLLIGYHGEKIKALKKLLTLMVNNEAADFTPVQVNINDYQEKREQSLHELADSAVEKALDSHQEILLPPLPSYERRIIHIYIEKEKTGVTTYSEGVGAARRLVVRPESQ